MRTVETLRAIAAESVKNNATFRDAWILVGGTTATLHDIQQMTNEDFQFMIVVTMVGIFIILFIILVSVLVPLRLMLTILLSISWTLAIATVYFSYAQGYPIFWIMPMVLFIVMMGLGLDYDIFLTTRIREEVLKGKTDSEAITTAVERTGSIITACGIIMAGAFGSMMISTMGMLTEFGFALGFAILLDAMLVRTYLVPAIMILLQKWNWWAPGWLKRLRGGKQLAQDAARRLAAPPEQSTARMPPMTKK